MGTVFNTKRKLQQQAKKNVSKYERNIRKKERNGKKAKAAIKELRSERKLCEQLSHVHLTHFLIFFFFLFCFKLLF